MTAAVGRGGKNLRQPAGGDDRVGVAIGQADGGVGKLLAFRRAVLGAIKMTGRRFISKSCAGKSFRNDFAQARLLFRPQQAAVDAAAHRIQQGQPIFQRRVFDFLPASKRFSRWWKIHCLPTCWA
jgi:hypothetical protein